MMNDLKGLIPPYKAPATGQKYQYGVQPIFVQALVDGYWSLCTLKNTPNTQALETRTAPSLAANNQWHVFQIGVGGGATDLTAIEGYGNNKQLVTDATGALKWIDRGIYG